MENKQRMHNEKLYFYDDESLAAEQLQCLETLYDFNQTRPSKIKLREEILKHLFADVGQNCYMEPPLHTSWGKHTHIGNDVMFGPMVTLSTAGHPIDPDSRKRALQFNAPIKIGSNVWIGANVVVLPGVTIGENTVIGAGSVVTMDIPANVVALGNPCRVSRSINDRDREFYYKNHRYDDFVSPQ